MGGSNSEIANRNTGGSRYYNNEEELVLSFGNLELGNHRNLLESQAAETSSSSSSSSYGTNNHNGNNGFVVYPQRITFLDDDDGARRVGEEPTIPRLPITYLSNSTSPPGSGCYLNSFKQWNQHSNYGGLVSREKLLGQARREDRESRFLQGESSNKMIMDDITYALFHSPDLFIAAALDERRSYAVQQLIRKLKNSPVAPWVTSALSTRCYEIMTHNRGKHVIKQCLVFLGNKPNQVLFEKAIKHCYELATHKEGCLSLNECITYISGPLREALLLRIAAESAYLSHDPNGNFVVQHVLSLHNPTVNAKICSHLRGRYGQLSINQRGSHIVEKCISWCILGMHYAVEEFLMKEKLLCQVARDEFGNYVIQTALHTTKAYASELYESLVNAIEANSSYIERSKFGRNVIYLIRGIVPNGRLSMRY